MAERIFEEIAVVIKKRYTVRLLEYKESGSEFTEITVYSRDVIEKDRDSTNNFEFSFTVKGKGEQEKEKIEKMNEHEFEEFYNHMTHFIEKKYNIVHRTEEEEKERKKDKKQKEAEKEVKKLVIDDVEEMADFNVEEDQNLTKV